MKMAKGVKYPAMIGSVLLGILAVEGGYVNHPSDPGGETNYGITKQVAVNHGYTEPMVDLPKELAMDIYADAYINKPNFNKILDYSVPVGTKVIDIGVNTGQGRAARWYQQSLNNFSRNCKDYPCIKVDGSIGASTLKAHENLIKKRGSVDSCKLLLRGLNTYQGHHYMSLTSLQSFNVGWFLNRINNISEAECELK